MPPRHAAEPSWVRAPGCGLPEPHHQSCATGNGLHDTGPKLHESSGYRREHGAAFFAGSRFLTTQLLSGLNPQQAAAVTLGPEHALILAGAGSGKTRVLTTRIAWLMANGRVSPMGILAVTFTNKAAREMLLRLSTLTAVNPKGMWVGTFHGLCNRMLRLHHRDAGLVPSFQILDTQDQLAAVKRLLKARNIGEDRAPPRQLASFINGCKEKGQRPADVEAFDDYNRRFVELYAGYDAQCQREGVVDFAELLLRSHELLERHQILREHYQQRFRHILVDEFQDTNALQYGWLKLLAGAGNAIFAVGDDDQSIYAFRGADVANMLAFEREFAVQHRVKLEQNYRSSGHILDCANALIAHNDRRLGKDLWTEEGAGERVVVQELPSDAFEAQWIVEQVRAIVRDGDRRSDVGILYRSNAQSRSLEHALFSAGIAYRVYGGLRFFERAEIKHALAYLRLIEREEDDGAFLRVANFPLRGIGTRSLEQLQDLARAKGCSLMEAVRTASEGGPGGASLGRLRQFAQLISRLRQESALLALPDAVRKVINDSGLVAHYSMEREGQDRLENLEELVNAAAAFVQEESFGLDTPSTLAALETEPVGVLTLTPLAAFLAHASLEAGEHQARSGDDAVQMMTAHAAKGLEFRHVFITGLEEGLFPHENALSQEEGLEEERRLMYVGITRARQRLYLSFAQTRMLHGHTRYNLRSRFLEELPDAAVRWLSPRTSQRSSSSWAQPQWSRHNAGSDRQHQGHPGPEPARPGHPLLHQPLEDQACTVQLLVEHLDSIHPLRVGSRVRHGRFGEGVVIELEGRGRDARAQIRFGAHGIKWLALSVARLEVL